MISTMIMNSSDLLIRPNHARRTNGDSTTPRKSVAPPPSPTTPLTPSVRCKAHESPRTTARNMPQCQSSAEIAEKTMISGKIWKATMTGASAPGFSRNGIGAPPV